MDRHLFATLSHVCIASVLLLISAPELSAQKSAHSSTENAPTKIERQFVILPDSIAQIQWTHTLDPVNAPSGLNVVNPGQCIRVGIYATGAKRDQYIKSSLISFRVQLAGKTTDLPLTPAAMIKRIKPEGSDFVSQALGAAGVKMPDPMKSFATLGISSGSWCVPAEASDGTAMVEVMVNSPGGNETLHSSKLEVESFSAGSDKSFKDANELGGFLLTYYRQPEPARLLPATRFVISDQAKEPQQGMAENFAAFLTAALAADHTGAQEFANRIASADPVTRAFGLLSLRAAGVDISSALSGMSPEQKAKFDSMAALQDPYDFSPTPALLNHMDMLWAVYGATGDYKPVRTVANALQWRSDYEKFDKLRKSPKPGTDWNPSIIRGVVYAAAGWSLRSFQRNDPLVADYIDYMLGSADTPDAVRSELKSLSVNPAFKNPQLN